VGVIAKTLYKFSYQFVNKKALSKKEIVLFLFFSRKNKIKKKRKKRRRPSTNINKNKTLAYLYSRKRGDIVSCHLCTILYTLKSDEG
jgi:hypothetical protein